MPFARTSHFTVAQLPDGAKINTKGSPHRISVPEGQRRRCWPTLERNFNKATTLCTDTIKQNSEHAKTTNVPRVEVYEWLLKPIGQANCATALADAKNEPRVIARFLDVPITEMMFVIIIAGPDGAIEADTQAMLCAEGNVICVHIREDQFKTALYPVQLSSDATSVGTDTRCA